MFRYYEKGNPSMCKNEANSCERDLCECDFAFAKAHVQAIGSFNEDYHLFWTKTGWYPEDSCPQTGGTAPVAPECCYSPTGAAVLYNRKGLIELDFLFFQIELETHYVEV